MQSLCMFKRTRQQTGQLIETNSAFSLRYYSTTATGDRKKITVKLADKSDTIRTRADVEHLIEKELAKANGQGAHPAKWSVEDFVEHKYLPWVTDNKAAVTAYSYKRLWQGRWKDHIGKSALDGLQTAEITRILTAYAKEGYSGRTLSHIKWFLSGVFDFAIAQGVVKENPAFAAQWLHKVARAEKPPEYALDEVLAMLAVLEPKDIRAAVAVALAYFAALRPAEIRGLRWEDYDGQELQVSRSVWRQHVGETKTEGSAASVPVIEPLKGLLERLGAKYGRGGYILQSAQRMPLDLNSLNVRTIAPTLKAAGIAWHGFYPGRRGISSLVTDTSKNALNSTGLLRHSNPVTALKYYTRAQKDSIRRALEDIERLATKEPAAE